MSIITRMLWALKPFMLFIDKFFTKWSTIKLVTGDHYYMWRDKILPGYVFLTSAAGHGSNIINTGEYKHGAIYFGRGLKTAIKIRHEKAVKEGDGELAKRLFLFVNDESVHDDICYVLESIGDGVVATNLVKFLTTKDVVKILKPKFTSNEGRRSATINALESLGLPYDFGFTNDNGSKYCFELVAEAYENATGVRLERIVISVLGFKLHSVFDAETFTEHPDKWECVIDSRDYTKVH